MKYLITLISIFLILNACSDIPQPDCSAYPLIEPLDASKVAPLNYCFIGDSLTANFDFNAYIPRTINLAIGGSKVVNIIEKQLPLILSSNIDVCFILAGVNDLRATYYISEELKVNYKHLLDILAENNIKTYTLSVLPIM